MSAVSILDGVAYSLATASAFAGFGALLTGRERAWRLLTTAGAGVLLVECLLHRAWVAAGVQAVIIALVLGSGRRNRRGRKTARAVGAKSRALLAAVVKRAREAGSRSPVSEGARA